MAIDLPLPLNHSFADVFIQLILTDLFYGNKRNLFLAVAHEQTPHIARILSSEGCNYFKDDDEQCTGESPK